MTGAPSHPPVPQAAMDAATEAIRGEAAHQLHRILGQGSRSYYDQVVAEATYALPRQLNELVSAAFAAVVPEGLFIAPHEDGGMALFRPGTEERPWPSSVLLDVEVGDELWALLAALIPTREEA